MFLKRVVVFLVCQRIKNHLLFAAVKTSEKMSSTFRLLNRFIFEAESMTRRLDCAWLNRMSLVEDKDLPCRVLGLRPN